MKLLDLLGRLCKLLLVFLCMYPALGPRKAASEARCGRMHRNAADMSLPHLLLYYTVAVSLFGSLARLFGVFRDTLKHLVSTALSLISTETLLFTGVSYLRRLDGTRDRHPADRDESSACASLSLRLCPLSLLVIEQTDLMFASCKVPMLMISSFYALYGCAISVLGGGSGRYIGGFLQGLSAVTRMLFFAGLTYTTMVFHVYITAVNRLSHRQ